MKRPDTDGNGSWPGSPRVSLHAAIPDIAGTARRYAASGLWVLALQNPRPGGGCSCGDPVCPTPGKHLRNRCATRDPGILDEWWRKWPDANVGLPTGRENGFLVLDVDPQEGGGRTLQTLTRRHGPLPPTVEVRTGSHGRHLYFLHPGTRVPNRNDWQEGIDLRGDGGYVVAPPSVHGSGRTYEWVRRLGFYPLAEPPFWLLRLLREPRARHARR